MARDGARNREPSDRARSRFAVQRSDRPQSERDEGHGGHGRSVSSTRQCDGRSAGKAAPRNWARPERHMDRSLHGRTPDVGFTLFFGSENLLAQVSMTGVLSVLVTMGLVVIISIDHPFTGPVYIHPDALALVLSDHEPPK